MKHYLDMTPKERRTQALGIGKAVTWPEAGLIFCEKMQTWCASINMTDGTCTAPKCNMKDKEKIKREKELTSSFRKEGRGPEEYKEYEEGQIRRQTQTIEDLTAIRIRKRKERMMRLYEYGEPKKAQKVALEINRIERSLEND